MPAKPEHFKHSFVQFLVCFSALGSIDGQTVRVNFSMGAKVCGAMAPQILSMGAIVPIVHT